MQWMRRAGQRLIIRLVGFAASHREQPEASSRNVTWQLQFDSLQ